MQGQKITARPGLIAGQASLALVYAAVLLALAVPAIMELDGSPFVWASDVRIQAILLIVIPSVVLLTSTLSARHSLAWSIYWTWSLIFLGLAAAYQMSGNAFPWKGQLREEHIRTAQQVILLAHITILAIFSARLPSVRSEPNLSAAPTLGLGTSPSLKKTVMLVMTTHILMATVFCAIMGPALFTGRSAFQARLTGMEGGLGFGSIYFLSNAGAMVIPAMAIILRKAGLDLPKFAIFFSVVISFLATNPLIGSRFLTGSFLVALIAASVSSYARRWIPVGLILAFVSVFPTLDLLRGDGTGATSIELTPPAETLTTFDYDAFEMLTREVSVQGHIPGGLPSQLELLIAPFLRWIPGLSQMVKGHASGPVVAMSSGMNFTNVSMPLWGEAHLIGSWAGVIVAFFALGWMLAKTRASAASANGRSRFGTLIEGPTAALLFIILRGSLYEVLGYLLLAAAIGLVFARAERRDRFGLSNPRSTWLDPYPLVLSPGAARASKTLMR